MSTGTSSISLGVRKSTTLLPASAAAAADDDEDEKDEEEEEEDETEEEEAAAAAAAAAAAIDDARNVGRVSLLRAAASDEGCEKCLRDEDDEDEPNAA